VRDVRQGRVVGDHHGGTLKGGADVDYLVPAAAGQTLEAKL